MTFLFNVIVSDTFLVEWNKHVNKSRSVCMKEKCTGYPMHFSIKFRIFFVYYGMNTFLAEFSIRTM